MKLKRIIAFLIALLLVLSLLPISKADTVNFTIEIGSGEGGRGQYVEIPIYFNNIPANNIIGACFDIKYDNTKFSITNEDVIPGELIINPSVDFSASINEVEGKITLWFADETGGDRPITNSGVFATIKLKILNNAEFGDYPIKVINNKGITDGNLNELKDITNYMDGQITVKNIYVPVVGIEITDKVKVLRVGEEISLTVTVMPESASNKSVVWESSNLNIVTVNENGNVEALSEGEAEIKVKSVDGNFEDKCKIYVLNQNQNTLSFRYAGTNRYMTAVEVSKKGFDRADTVVIAGGNDYPDALCVAPLAKKFNAPILLVSKTGIIKEIEEEIDRLGAKKAYIIGGTAVVPDEIKNQLENKGMVVERIAGNNRYETAYEVAKLLNYDKAVIASGEVFADALSISSIAAKNEWPILLTRKTQLPDKTIEIINNKRPKNVYVIGGTAVISDSVLNSIPNAKRIAGNDRYETNEKIAQEFKDELSYEKIFIATGKNFADALSASALAAKTDSFVFLTGDKVKDSTKNLVLANRKDTTVTIILGGDAVLPKEIIDLLAVPIK
ncbi:MAG: hypothetical protein JG776_987 [Caloramator sp.]|jgi:putative cell wall-binding protein|uniref:cell wall-binding repeat-containing protein n=1 Tax=Caloramator sp. TaxID=1871330 RepID=UPI001D37E266|nr:cell wall-binding repeat-containing protein [Caloramator sp.]MBZ4663285.1 hypothetical protein [Caloramator sp.]